MACLSIFGHLLADDIGGRYEFFWYAGIVHFVNFREISDARQHRDVGMPGKIVELVILRCLDDDKRQYGFMKCGILSIEGIENIEQKAAHSIREAEEECHHTSTKCRAMTPVRRPSTLSARGL